MRDFVWKTAADQSAVFIDTERGDRRELVAMLARDGVPMMLEALQCLGDAVYCPDAGSRRPPPSELS